jgi:hypothetical protein
MEKYKNRSGNSGVIAYEIGDDYITVWFVNGHKPNTYNSIRPGISRVAKMKELAILGQGLNTYISKYVGKNFYC